MGGIINETTRISLGFLLTVVGVITGISATILGFVWKLSSRVKSNTDKIKNIQKTVNATAKEFVDRGEAIARIEERQKSGIEMQKRLIAQVDVLLSNVRINK